MPARDVTKLVNVHSTKGRELISGALAGVQGHRAESDGGFVDMHSERGRWPEEKANTKRYLT